MIFKLGYNFMTNALGIRPWVNTAALCEPLFRFPLPHLPQLGLVREVGLCSFNPFLPIRTLIALLTTFGVAPLVVFSLLFSKDGRRFFKTSPFWMLLALLYGLLHFFLAIPAGTSVQRILGYGWPAFLLLIPFLMNRFFTTDRAFIMKLSLLHLFVSWLPFLFYATGLRVDIFSIPVLIAVFIAYFLSFRLLKSRFVL